MPDPQSPQRQSSEPQSSEPAGSGMTPADAAATLADLDQELNRLQRAIRLAIQGQLNRMAGQNLGDLKHNQQLAESIHRLLDSHGLRLRCSECGHPAILRVSARAGTPHGVFVFDHTIDGRRTFHGGRPRVPEIRLVVKPPRKKSNARRAAG